MMMIRMSPSRYLHLVRQGHIALVRPKCETCGSSQALTVDHLVPRHLHGQDVIGNYAILCQPCNSSKGIRCLPGDWRLRGPVRLAFFHRRVREAWQAVGLQCPCSMCQVIADQMQPTSELPILGGGGAIPPVVQAPRTSKEKRWRLTHLEARRRIHRDAQRRRRTKK